MTRRLTALSLLLLPVVPFAVERPQTNPFADLLKVPGQAVQVDRSSAVSMELRAVMTGGSRALANINGRILAVGEQYNGYELIAVNERTATLRSARGELKLTLVNAGEETNEN